MNAHTERFEAAATELNDAHLDLEAVLACDTDQPLSDREIRHACDVLNSALDMVVLIAETLDCENIEDMRERDFLRVLRDANADIRAEVAARDGVSSAA